MRASLHGRTKSHMVSLTILIGSSACVARIELCDGITILSDENWFWMNWWNLFLQFLRHKMHRWIAAEEKWLRRTSGEHNLKTDFYLCLLFRQPFARYVETGRVAKATSGPLRGKILTIVDCIDQTRVSAIRWNVRLFFFCFFFFCDDPYTHIGIADWHPNEAIVQLKYQLKNIRMTIESLHVRFCIYLPIYFFSRLSHRYLLMAQRPMFRAKHTVWIICNWRNSVSSSHTMHQHALYAKHGKTLTSSRNGKPVHGHKNPRMWKKWVPIPICLVNG